MMANAAKKTDSIWSKEFIAIFCTNFILLLGLNMSSGILGKYTESINGTPFEIGLVCSSFAITALVLKVISGPAIDSMRRRPVISIATAILALAFVGYSISTTVPTLTLSSLVRGTAQAFTVTATLVVAADMLPKERIAEGLGVFSLTQVLCNALGPMISLNLALYIGYRMTFVVAAVLELTAFIFIAMIPKDNRGTEKFTIALDRFFCIEAIFPSIIVLLASMGLAVTTSFVPVFGTGEGIPQSQVGLYFTVNAVALCVLRPLFGKFADRIGYMKIIVPGLVVYALSFAALAYTHSLPMLLSSSILAAFGFGASQPLLQALMMTLVPDEKRGAASCTYFFASDLGIMIGPNIAGLAVGAWGYPAMWLLMMVPIALSVICSFIVPMEKPYVPKKKRSGE